MKNLKTNHGGMGNDDNQPKYDRIITQKSHVSLACFYDISERS